MLVCYKDDAAAARLKAMGDLGTGGFGPLSLFTTKKSLEGKTNSARFLYLPG